MDHLLENQDKPIPDMADVSAAASASGASAAVDGDDENETEALKAVYGPAAGENGKQDVEAKVSGSFGKSLSCQKGLTSHGRA